MIGAVKMIGPVLDRLRDVRRKKVLTPDQAMGRRGEDLAHRFLRRRGYTIVARNYRLAAGDAEADLIAREGEDVVIVEVKTRATAEYGPPDRAVGPDKKRHLLRVAREYSRKTGTPLENFRIDVVGIVLTRPPLIELHRRAVPIAVLESTYGS
jgi:putative endonuclease